MTLLENLQANFQNVVDTGTHALQSQIQAAGNPQSQNMTPGIAPPGGASPAPVVAPNDYTKEIIIGGSLIIAAVLITLAMKK